LLKRAFPWLRGKPEPDQNDEEVIRGDLVVIREKRIEDAPDDYSWRVDDELARLDATRPIRMSFEDFLRYSRDELVYTSSTSKRLAIDTHDGKHVGNCMYYDIDLRRKRAELGIMVGDRDYWDSGYGTNSVDTLLLHMFTTTPLELVYLHTLEWNERARRSFAKSGFREIKKVRRSGLDFIYMEIDRGEWEERQVASLPLDDHTSDGKIPEQDGADLA
jgi:RimJ/RimL family protein N-acetyltransferase